MESAVNYIRSGMSGDDVARTIHKILQCSNSSSSVYILKGDIYS